MKRHPLSLIVDTTLHTAFTALYGIFVLTGIIAIFAFPHPLVAVTSREAALFWVLGLGVVSALSLVFSLRERWGRREMISTSILSALLVIYSASVLIWGLQSGHLSGLLVGGFSLSYAVFPLWRVRYLFKRYQK